MKKAPWIVALIILAPILLLTVSLRAADEWRPVGETPSGAKVSISSLRILKNGQRRAWVRVEYKEPTRLPQGGPFIELRARTRFSCNSGTSTPTSLWFYSRDGGEKLVVTKKTTRDDQFGKPSEGGFGDMVRRYVCAQSK